MHKLKDVPSNYYAFFVAILGAFLLYHVDARYEYTDKLNF